MPEKPAAPQPAASTIRRGSDPLVDWMTDNGVPVTRDAYLGLAYGGELPDPWTADHEMDLPEPLQDASKITG